MNPCSLIESVSIGICMIHWNEFEILENSLPFSNSYLTLAHKVIKIPVGGGVRWNNWIRKRAPVSACMQIGGQFGAYIRRRGVVRGRSRGREGVRDEPKSRGKFYRIFKTCFDLQMPAPCHRERNSECKEGGGGCSVTVLRRGKRMPRRWRCAHDENRCILLPA